MKKLKRTHEDYLNMLGDPSPEDNPYPEFESEVFSSLESMGVKPEDLKDKTERENYAKFLAEPKT